MRTIAALAGFVLFATGAALCVAQTNSRFSGLVVVGLALLARAAWWTRGPALLAQPGRRPRLAMLAACLVVVGMYTANTDMGDPMHAELPRGNGAYLPVLARGDGHMLYLMARSTALDLDWSFDNDLARFGDPWTQPVTKTGRKSIAHPIGPALVWTPLIWVADIGAWTARMIGFEDVQLHGYTLWTQRFVFLSSALFACAAAWLGRAMARRLLGTSERAWSPTYGAIAVLLGTSVLYYATFMPSYAHAMDAFACAGFLAYWIATLGRTDWKRWVVLGVLLGIAALIRVQELAFGIAILVEACWRPSLRKFVGGALVLAVALVVFTPQLLEWHLVFGSALELPQGARYTRLEAPMIAELLWAPRNGWLASTPIAYFGLIGLCMLPRSARLPMVGLLAVVAVQVYLNSTILDWWGGASFGQRRMCNVTLPLVVGMATLAWRANRVVRRARVKVVLALGVLAIFVGFNIARVFRLHSGRGGPTELARACCEAFPAGKLRGAAQAIYDVIGSPFQFPANAVFAIRHDVAWKRWDDVVGDYPLVPPLGSLVDGTLEVQEGRWPIGKPGMERFLVDGFTAQTFHQQRTFRFTTAASATVLVPNLMPYGQRLRLWLKPAGGKRVTIRWNGEVMMKVDLPSGWTPLTWSLPDIGLHTNELTIESTPGPTLDGMYGVAVGDLEMQFLGQ